MMLVRINVMKGRINIMLVRTWKVKREMLEPELGILVPVGAAGLLSLFQHSDFLKVFNFLVKMIN